MILFASSVVHCNYFLFNSFYYSHFCPFGMSPQCQRFNCFCERVESHLQRATEIVTTNPKSCVWFLLVFFFLSIGGKKLWFQLNLWSFFLSFKGSIITNSLTIIWWREQPALIFWGICCSNCLSSDSGADRNKWIVSSDWPLPGALYSLPLSINRMIIKWLL